MKAQVTAINQDGNAGDFFHHGACTTPADAAAEIAKGHASTFGCTLADQNVKHTYKQYTAGRG